MESKSMNKEKFNDFCNDMLAAYIDNNDPEASEFDPVIAKHQVDIDSPEGHELIEKATAQVITWINGDYSFDQLTTANQNRIIGIEIANIIEDYGAVSGKDIQHTEYGLMISPELLEKIAEDLPSGTIQEMRNRDMICNQNPYELLEQDLGVPFFDSLQAIAKLRVQTLSDSQAKIYCTFFIGIEKRHSWLMNDNFFARFVTIVYGKDLCEDDKVNNNTAERVNVSAMALDDLLTALGRMDHEFDPVTGEKLLKRADFLALDKVHLPKNSSWLEMADAMPEID
jgi:hypothetical protein